MNNEELKALAEAATPSKWTTDGEKTVMSAESDQLNAGYAIFECHGPDALKNAKFAAAANPAVVLGLIADNASLRGSLKSYSANMKKQIKASRKVERERDVLKAENAHLKNQEIEVRAGKALAEEARDLYAADKKNLAFALNNARAEAAALKAECEGLRAELAAVYPFKPAQDAPVIGYTGCVICGKYTDHGGLQCPKTLAFSLARDNQRIVPPEPMIAGPHPLDLKGGQSNE